MSSPGLSLPVAAAPHTVTASPYWLFSVWWDGAAFLGSAILALLLLALGAQRGWLYAETPEWMWVGTILLVDVAHVHATNYKVYFDTAELRRRPYLYTLAPLVGYALGAALYSENALWFWRGLAYLAVFHFVRQQYGWVKLYRRRLGETGTLGYIIDTTAIYAATVYPLLYWHAHLPRRFWWFLRNDFAGLPLWMVKIALPLYVLALTAYTIRALARGVLHRQYNPGKDIVLVTTAVCWYVGIVSYNSDYAFTVTNVIIHGVPYFILVYWHARQRRDEAPVAYRWLARGPVFFLLALWLLAYVEEFFWDKAVWHERSWLFGAWWEADGWKMWLVPLLALPQITHYILDGFIWRRRH